MLGYLSMPEQADDILTHRNLELLTHGRRPTTSIERMIKREQRSDEIFAQWKLTFFL